MDDVPPLDTELLRASFKKVAGHAADLAGWFYTHLFMTAPYVRLMFPDDMEVQRERFLNALIHIVGNAGNLPGLVPYLQRLSRDHVTRYGVRPEHYVPVGVSLLSALERYLGAEEWTPDTERAWTTAYRLIAQVMIDTASEGWQ